MGGCFCTLSVHEASRRSFRKQSRDEGTELQASNGRFPASVQVKCEWLTLTCFNDDRSISQWPLPLRLDLAEPNILSAHPPAPSPAVSTGGFLPSIVLDTQPDLDGDAAYQISILIA